MSCTGRSGMPALFCSPTSWSAPWVALGSGPFFAPATVRLGRTKVDAVSHFSSAAGLPRCQENLPISNTRVWSPEGGRIRFVDLLLSKTDRNWRSERGDTRTMIKAAAWYTTARALTLSNKIAFERLIYRSRGFLKSPKT